MTLTKFTQLLMEKVNPDSDKILFIVDVQKAFSKFFDKDYVESIAEYCTEFDKVYQIWDNHFLGKMDGNYLYNDQHPENKEDLYNFPNEVMAIEKRYNYNVDADFYQKILTVSVYNDMKYDQHKIGDLFNTKHGTKIVYTGNKHRFFQASKILLSTLNELKGKSVTLIGGAGAPSGDNGESNTKGECIHDIYVLMKALGINVKYNEDYIYSAKGTPQQQQQLQDQKRKK